jgi:uncharacterized delta-60 repeat protein
MVSIKQTVLMTVFLTIITSGCAGNNLLSPSTAPEIPTTDQNLTNVNRDSTISQGGHYSLLYSMIQFDVTNPDDVKYEIIPLRESEIHLNILKLLEVGPCTNCFKIVGFNIPVPGVLNVDIEIKHPFPDLDLSVFDMRGIIMFNGSLSFPAAGETISDSALGDGALLNADGYTALYNGSTIGAPVGDFQKYFPGNLSTANIPNATVNGYLRHNTDNPANTRNAFYAGDAVTRTYSLKMPTVGVFRLGYAVDANWWPATSTPVDDPIADFGPEANCPEAWKVVVTEEPIGQGLTDQGGQTKLLIDVYDWQGKTTHHDPVVECPELFDGLLTATWVSDGSDYTRYETTISNTKLASIGDYICLVSVEANENDSVGKPWLDLKAYQLQTLTVVEKITENPVAIAEADPNPQAVNLLVHFSGSGSSDPDGGNIQLFEWDWSTDGVYDQTGENLDHTWSSPGTYYVQLRVTDDDGETDILDQPLQIIITTHQPPEACGQTDDPLTPIVCNPVHFIDCGSVAYDGATILNREWDWNNDGTYDEAGGDLYHSWDVPGTYFVQYRVTDSQGASDELAAPIEISVSGALPTAVANADNYAPNVGDTVHFDGTGSFDNDCGGAAITTWEWDWDNDGTYDESGAETDHSWAIVGTFYVQLRVTDNEGQTDTLGVPLEVVTSAEPGNLVWAKSAGSTGDYEEGHGITALSDNSTVMTGSFRLSATFGLGDPNQIDLISAGDDDIFIARYNADGTLAWAKRAGGTAQDAGYGITALSDNSTVVTGFFKGSATFGQGEPNQTALTSAGGWDIFIAQYNTDGTLDWAKRAGGTSNENSTGITTLSDNSTVVIGKFYDSVTFGSGEPNQKILTSAGIEDIFIARYNTDGSLAWAKRAGGTSWEIGSAITNLSDNSIVVTGYFSDLATFGPGDIYQTTLTSAGGYDIFVARYNPDGSIIWATRAGSASGWNDWGRGITSLSDNSTVVTGWFSDLATFGSGEPNQTVLTSAGVWEIFVARYNPDGTLAWAKSAEGAGYDYSSGITALSDNSSVITGAFEGSAIFGSGEPNQTILTSGGGDQFFIARYNPDGTLAWAKCDGEVNQEFGDAITALSDNTTVVTGAFYGSATFGPGEANETILTSAGDWDIFIARFYP